MITSDDIVMQYKERNKGKKASYIIDRVCVVCGYAKPKYYQYWDHTLTDCLRNLKKQE